jgi:hypothetical protein
MKSSDTFPRPETAKRKENITSCLHQVFHPPFAEKRHKNSLFGILFSVTPYYWLMEI